MGWKNNNQRKDRIFEFFIRLIFNLFLTPELIPGLGVLATASGDDSRKFN